MSRLTFCACFALFLAGCSVVVPTERTQLYPATVELPVRAVGIQDARAAFRATLCEVMTERASIGPNWDCENVLHRFSDEPLLAVPPASRSSAKKTRRLIFVPGIFGECVEKHVKPFETAYERLRSLGHKVDFVSLSGRSGSTHNATQLRDKIEVLRKSENGKFTLITYSKGAPDALEMLVNHPETAEWVEAVVSVAGAVSGSPIADSLDAVYDHLARHLALAPCTPGDGLGVHSLTNRVRQNWLASNSLPASVKFYSLAAIASAEGVSFPLDASHRTLNHISARNDGQLLASQAVIPGATLLGYPAADHWAVSLPFDESHFAFKAFITRNNYPRDLLIEAIVRFLD